MMIFNLWFLTVLVNYFLPVLSQPWLSTHNITYNNDNYLVETPGCKIPDFYMPFARVITDTKYLCGRRKVFIRKIGNNRIRFRFREAFMSCRFRFIYRFPSIKYNDYLINYGGWVKFRDRSIANLNSDYLQVKCDPGYDDLFIAIKKKKMEKKSKSSWNVLIIAMDTVSRARAIHDLPRMYNLTLAGKWLEFRGYNKIAYDTVPNLMSVLTSREHTQFNKRITQMSKINHLLIWKHFEKAGYVTAFGEDELFMMNSSSSKMMQFKHSPTMHYLRGLFVAGEENINTIACPKKLTSGEYVLQFASDFAKTYLKSDRFFGFFWISSLSTATSYGLSQIDRALEIFLKTLKSSGVLKNTFVIMLGDHGTLFGPDMIPVESYYESRLPMLFMSMPTNFIAQFPDHFEILAGNQNRLVTPFDLHLTLWDIMTNIENSIDIPKLEFCPKCSSLFSMIDPSRTCEDVGIDEKWCTCHSMHAIRDPNDYGAFYSIVQTLFAINNMTQSVETKNCTRCADLSLKKLLRIHMYEGYVGSQMVQYYEMVVILAPEDVGFLASVRRFANNTFDVIQPIYVIGSSYTNNSNCVENSVHKVFCVCTKIKCPQRTSGSGPNRTLLLPNPQTPSTLILNDDVKNVTSDSGDTIWSAMTSWMWPSKKKRVENSNAAENTKSARGRIWPKQRKKKGKDNTRTMQRAGKAKVGA